MNESDTPPIVNLTGAQVALGPLHRGSLPLLVHWENDSRPSISEAKRRGHNRQKQSPPPGSG